MVLHVDAKRPPAAVLRAGRRVPERVLRVELLRNALGRRRQILRASHHFRVSPARTRDLAQRLGVHARAHAPFRRRVDGDGVDERIAAPEGLARLHQRVIARGVRAIGDDDERRAGAVVPLHHRTRREDRVVDRRAAGGPLVREPPRQPRRRRRPRYEDARQVIERADERLVSAVEQVGHEPVERAARVDDRLPAHAVADVEQHADAYRRPLVRELRHRLRVTVLEDLEVVLRQAGDQAIAGVGDGDGDFNGRDAAAKGLGSCRGREDAVHHERRDEHEGKHKLRDLRVLRG